MLELPNQAQSVGDLVGRAIRLLRQNFLLIVQVLLLPSAGATLGKVGLQWGIINLKEPYLFWPSVASLIAGFFISVCFLCLLTLRQVALVRLLNSDQKDFIAAYKAIKKRSRAIISIFLLTHVMMIFNASFFIAELVILVMMSSATFFSHFFLFVLGFLSLIGLLAGALYITLFSFILFSSLALSNQNLTALIKEAFSLVEHDFARASFFTLLLIVQLAFLIPPLSLPLIAFSLLDALKPHAHATAWLMLGKHSLFTLVFSQTWESLVNMIIWPITFLAFGLFFRDLKMRQHASDLFRDLEELEYGKV